MSRPSTSNYQPKQWARHIKTHNNRWEQNLAKYIFKMCFRSHWREVFWRCWQELPWQQIYLSSPFHARILAALHFFGHSGENAPKDLTHFKQDVCFGRYKCISRGNKCMLQILEIKEPIKVLPKSVLLSKLFLRSEVEHNIYSQKLPSGKERLYLPIGRDYKFFINFIPVHLI